MFEPGRQVHGGWEPPPAADLPAATDDAPYDNTWADDTWTDDTWTDDTFIDGSWVEAVIDQARAYAGDDRAHLAALLTTGAPTDPDFGDLGAGDLGAGDLDPGDPEPDPDRRDRPGSDAELVAGVVQARQGQARLVWAELSAIAELVTRWSTTSPLDDTDCPTDRAARLRRLDRAARRRYLDPHAGDLAPSFVVAEIAAATGISQYAASRRLDAAHDLIIDSRLPGTARALREGTLDWDKAQAIVTGTQDLTPTHATQVETLVLPTATTTPVGALHHTITAAVTAVDPHGTADRAARAHRDRHLRYRALPDAMGQLTATMTATDLADLRAHLDHATDLATTTGDPRTRNQIAVDTLLHAVTRHHSTPRPNTTQTDTSTSTSTSTDRTDRTDRPDRTDQEPPDQEPPDQERPAPHLIVTVTLDTLLGLRDDPAHLDRYGPIPATLARDLATRGTWQCAATDNHGTLLGLGRSTYTPQYTPGRGLVALVRTRDRTCTFPTCTARADRCDLDHRTPYRHPTDTKPGDTTPDGATPDGAKPDRGAGDNDPPGGATCDCNLQVLCRRHHRLKTTGLITATPSTNPADPPGTLTWTTRAGLTHPRPPTPTTPFADTIPKIPPGQWNSPPKPDPPPEPDPPPF